MPVDDSQRPIDRIQIAKPCPVSWRSMQGDNRVRHCSNCNRNVYNVIGLSTDEVMDLILKSEGSICLRMYRRPDGTVMTKDCGFRKKIKGKALIVLTPLLTLFGFAMVAPMATSGVVITPERVIRSYERRIKWYEDEMKSSKDPEEIKYLRERMIEENIALAEYKKSVAKD